MQICKGIEMIEGFGPDCNVYVVDNSFIVDAGTGDHFANMKEHIESACEPDNIKLLINTHGHFDHAGGNKKFRDWLKLEIAVHPADRRAVETGAGALAEMFGHTARIMTADRLLRNGATIATKNFSFEVMHTPGHTPGSICLYDRQKRILVSGDTLFDNAVGRTDFPGGSKEQLIASLGRLAELNPECLLPGHGQPKFGGVGFMTKQMINFLTEAEYV